ncbi:DNA-3-methyladenine glycosylase family protein [Nannocystaceae bacterium ST9]
MSGPEPEPARRRWPLDGPLDLEGTTMIGDFGRGNPSVRRLAEGELAQAVWTPEGPATLHLRIAAGELEATTWGEGREALMAALPGYVGLDDRPPRFGGPLASLERRAPGLRCSRAPNLFDVIAGHVIRQRVAWRDAVATQIAIMAAHALAAPGPFALKLPLSPAQWGTLGASDLAAFGLERKRASTLLGVAARAERIVGWATLGSQEFGRRLELLAGIGPWTRAQVQAIGLGDPDAVPLGDYELPSMVAHVLAGEPRADDARMLELLEPWRGHRNRVIRLLRAAGVGAPRFGPRVRGTEPGKRGF